MRARRNGHPWGESMREIVYLGPEGTYSHEVARKRFRGEDVRFVPRETVRDICRYVARRRDRCGVMPIVNSTGGTIYDTVDMLLDETLGLRIDEEISLHVRLALLGHKGKAINTVYSHPIPLEHCESWITKKYPHARAVATPSTAAAALNVVDQDDAAAISSRAAAARYGLDVLTFPIPGASETNVTHFYILTRERTARDRVRKTSLAVRLTNRPGSLLSFLQPIADAGLNLSRIISRPIKGMPNQFAFFLDVEGNANSPALKNALEQASEHADVMRMLGSYPSFRTYTS